MDGTVSQVSGRSQRNPVACGATYCRVSEALTAVGMQPIWTPPTRKQTSMNDVHGELFYGGRWNTPSAGAGVIDVIPASTEEVIESVPDPLEADIDAAVTAARTA